MYEKLLLVNGGGVTGEAQKGIQAEDCVNIVIGLGGTGKFCVRMVKTYAYERLRLNDDDINGEFKHIRFFAVDTDFNNQSEEQEKVAYLRSLTTDDEEIDIDVSSALQHMGREPWNDWWFLGDSDSTQPLGNGAGGERRLGRLYLSYAAQKVKNKISSAYQIATENINTDTANIYFHIVSGMGGGTGSGTFIDMCYLLKQQYPNAHIIGYFFLPKVNADVVTDAETKNYILQNGYAAMQDLDYTMQLAINRGAFSQIYRDGSGLPTEWKGAPVEMCHIISNQGAVGTGIGKKGYTYAMNVVAEYIMDFLVKSSSDQHTLFSEISNKDARVDGMETHRRSGFSCGYSTMGSSSATVPYREINTYVISNLFAKFSEIFNAQGNDIPSAKDCFNILKAAFAPNATTFEDLNRSVYQKTSSGLNTGVYTPYSEDLTEINWLDVVTDDDELKKLRAEILIPKPLHAWYNKQYADKTGVITKNVRSLTNAGNKESLINLIREQLDILTRNIHYGPSFSLKSIDAAVKDSLKDIIEGLIAANKTMLDNTSANLFLRAKDYNDAVNVIKKKNAKHKRGENALNALVAFYNQLALIDLYEGIIKVLTDLKDQLIGDTKKHYARLETVYNELRARFDSNLQVIESNNSTVVDTSYAEYLVTIDQLRSFLDAELEMAVPNIPNTFEAFMAWISDSEYRELLLPEREKEFIGHINRFFIDDRYGLFNGLVKMTIDDYLRMACANANSISDWHNVTNDQVQGYVLIKMRELLNKARPLLTINSGIQSSIGDSDGWVTIPAGSAAILAAVQQAISAYPGLKVSQSAMADRIFIEERHDGISLSAVGEVSELEGNADRKTKRHLYSGAPSRDGVFNDWGKLPPLTPYQKWAGTNPRFDDIKESARVFDDALDAGLIVPKTIDYLDGIIIRNYDDGAIVTLKDRVSQFVDIINGYDSFEMVEHQNDLNAQMGDLRNKLNTLFDDVAEKEFAFDVMPAGTDDPVEYRKAFYRDMFVRAPQIVMDVKKQLACSDKYTSVIDAMKACEQLLNEKIDEAKITAVALPVFETALYVGVFTIKGNNITCECKDEKTGRNLVPMPLTDATKRDVFPCSNIPIYQAFLSFMKLDVDVITKIGKIADNKANDMFNPGSSVDESVESFMARMSVWYNLAERYSDSNKIIKFLENENQQFRYFKEERGL